MFSIKLCYNLDDSFLKWGYPDNFKPVLLLLLLLFFLTKRFGKLLLLVTFTLLLMRGKIGILVITGIETDTTFPLNQFAIPGY